MKKLFLSFLPLLFCTGLLAQNAESTRSSNTEQLIATLHLNADQQSKMQKIKDRREAQLEQIASLKSMDEDQYYSRLEEIINGNNISVQMVLNRQQLKTFQENARAIREMKAEKLKEMRNQGASRMERERALLDLEAALSFWE